jgi:hypothetical protein
LKANLPGLHIFILLLVKIPAKDIGDDEKHRIIQSDDFAKFLSKKTRILERALDQDDIFFDYGGSDKNKE